MGKYDFLIVGAGFSGSVIAERLASQLEKRVLVVEKKDHLAGNCYDRIDDAGVLIHQYGPHYFRTKEKSVFNYLSQFTDWIPQRYKIRVNINGKFFTFPINLTTLEEFFGRPFTEEEAKRFLETERDTSIINPANAKEQVLMNVGRRLYEAFFAGYTRKQWGVPVEQLDSSVTRRIPIRTNRDDDYIVKDIQAMPGGGYTKIIDRMLDKKGIEVKLNTPFDKGMLSLADTIVWTGPIDQFYNYKFGRLPYRSLEFVFISFFGREFVQDRCQINYPSEDVPYTRTVEIKHVTKQKCPNTTLSIEFPRAEGEPYYPIPTRENRKLYERYLEEGQREKNIFFIGRLAQYVYMDMDEAVKNALELFEKIKNGK